MGEEITRSMNVLGKKATPPPYYIGYRITDIRNVEINASYGALEKSADHTERVLDVDVRVGSHQLDSSHKISGGMMFNLDALTPPVLISMENNPDAIKAALWQETDKKYKAAAEKLIKVKADQKVSVKKEDQSDDFSKEKKNTFNGELVSISPDFPALEKKLKQVSAVFNSYKNIYKSSVSLTGTVENKFFVNSENSQLQHGRTLWRLRLTADTVAEDGMKLYKSKVFDCRNLNDLPDDKIIADAARQLAKDVLALRNAPAMEPFTGPAILSGEAAGVFFHEIFGHRIEGHRQKDENFAQTFTKKVNEKILPEFISVYDDPTQKNFGDADLNGFFHYDDEGVKAQRVTVVEKGDLKNFLMSRSPIKDFALSNGHGRAEPGKKPVSRQGNLIIQSAKTVPMDQLRKLLIKECKVQKKDYGLMFEAVSGGFTFTGRFMPQSFNVTPITVYRIYVDGRPDELVRGVSLIGTPLTSFSKIIACGDKPGVFNGNCGAESGMVPVSAVCPPLLTGQIEVQKKEKASDKPPVMAPPERRTK